MNIRKLLLLSTLTLIPQLSLAENIIRTKAPIFAAKEKPTTPMAYGSCLEIKQAKPSSASGVHTVTVNSIEFPVYCDMESDGGGWTMVVAQFEYDPAYSWNEGIQTDYDPSLSNAKGFALNMDQIPVHSQTGFGRDTHATEVDFINFVYTTGNIAVTRALGLKNDVYYDVHRNLRYYYAAHHPGASTGTYEEWSNTLTFNRVGPLYSYTWAFSPKNSLAYKRGYSFLKDNQASSEKFAWTVWVR